METLRRLLEENGKDPFSAEALASKYGYDSELTDEDAALIVGEELNGGGKLAPTTSGEKPTRSRGRPKGSRNRKKTKDISSEASSALSHAAAQTSTEITNLVEPLAQRADAASTHYSEQMINIVRNVPQDTLEKFVALVKEEQADAEGFRQIGEEFAQELFPLEPDDAA